MEHESSPESSDNPLARRAGGLHDFVVPDDAKLERDAELECVNAIERGRVALDAIAGPIESELIALVTSWLQTLIPLKIIEAIVPAVVREQICRQATLDRSYEAVGSAIATRLQAQFRALIDERPAETAGEAPGVVEQVFPEARLTAGFSADALSDHSLWDEVAGREKAITTLVNSHYRLATPFARAAMRHPSEYEDLLSEAFFILRRAAIGFDGAAENRFSSYAKKALKNELKRQSPTTKGLSRHTRDQLVKFESAAASLTQARRGAVPSSDVLDEFSYTARTRKMIENARCLLAAQRRQPERGEPLILEAIEQQVRPACRDVFDPEECRRLRAACRVLTLQEKRLIVRHYFLCESTRDLAERYGVSQQKILRSLDKARRKLGDRLKPK